ncbi:MAG TPA: DUF6494 family protein [Gammaproteobacteria bacterium]|nr:DUF6494 family protein [Gammaproteobacteria bacterium]
MKEDTFNMSVRKFLKKVGVTSQREIEKLVDEAVESGKLEGNESLDARVTLEVDKIGLKTDITGKINLE